MPHHIIGRESEQIEIEVDQRHLRLLALASGGSGSAYSDAAAARAAGLTTLPAPPPFAFVLELLAPSKLLSLESLGMEIGEVLMGGIAVKHFHPIQVGDRIRLKTRVKDAYEKKCGFLRFLVLESELRDRDGRLCARIELRPIVRRSLAAAA